jgi:hypothetical protein
VVRVALSGEAWLCSQYLLASFVMLSIIVWLFSDGEPEGAWVMLGVLVVGYAALGLSGRHADTEVNGKASSSRVDYAAGYAGGCIHRRCSEWS